MLRLRVPPGVEAFLAACLVLTIVNLGVYIPLPGVTPCSCRSGNEVCTLHHSCPHCNAPDNKAQRKSSGGMCHPEGSGAHKGMISADLSSSDSEHACGRPQEQKPGKSNRSVEQKILNPTCGASPAPFTLQARIPFVLSEYFTYKRRLQRSFITIPPFPSARQVYLDLPDKPPPPAAILT